MSSKKVLHFEGSVEERNIGDLIERIEKAILGDLSQEIELSIVSLGGKFEYAVAFFDWVRIRGIRLTTIAVGEVASAGIYIFLAGQKRKAGKNCVFFFHESSQLFRSETRLFTTEIERLGKELVHDQERGNRIVSEVTGLDVATVRTFETAERRLSAAEAVRLGIAHEIV